MMSFPTLLTRFITHDRPDVLGDKVATRSRTAVWERVAHRIGSLTLAEARGYIRARGAAVIQKETDLLIAEEGPRLARLHEQILSHARDAIIRLTLEQLQISRRTLMPVCGDAARKAA